MPGAVDREPPLLQTSYEDETVQDVIEVVAVEVIPPEPEPEPEAEPEAEAEPEPDEIHDEIDDQALGDEALDDDLVEIDLTEHDPTEPEIQRQRRPRLSVIWPGDSGSSVPSNFPGSVSSGLASDHSGTRTVVQPRGLRAVVAAVYAALADPLVGGDETAREQRAQRVRTAGIVAGSTVLSAVLVYTIFPVRTYLDQRAATQRSKEEIEVLSEANEKLAERAEDLRTPEVVEEKARADYGLVFPDEESYRVLPPPVVTTIPPTTTTIPPLP